MTRFEKWIAKQVEKWLAKQGKVNIICHADSVFCERCVILPVCDKYKDRGSVEGFRDEAEAYLDEEVEDEESVKRTD